jgi:hypothetical protein
MSEREKRMAIERQHEVLRLIEAAESRVAEIEKRFADPGFYARTSPEEVRGLEVERTGLQEELKKLMAEWEAGEEQLQAQG